MDHDGTDTDIGGIEKWLRLGEAVGLKREELLAQSRLLPGVRYAVDAYVNFCRTQPWIIAMASSLTELFAPSLMAKRIAAFEKHYPWVKEEGLRYFRGRLTQAPRDAEFALRLVVERCRSRELAGTGRGCFEIQMRIALGHAGCHALRVCFEPQKIKMTAIADTSKPRLADKARLKWDAVREKHLLLFPKACSCSTKPRMTCSRCATASARLQKLSKLSPRNMRPKPMRLPET